MNGTPPFFACLYSRQILLSLLLVLSVTACSSDRDEIKKGEVLFSKTHIGKNKVIGCIACHSTTPNQVIIGPSLAGISERAQHQVPGQSAEEFIKNSIVSPDAYIASGYMPATMYSHYSNELANEEIEALVAYLLTL
ncbi:MAG: c-type cytochrome [Cocleimonas sp.]